MKKPDVKVFALAGLAVALAFVRKALENLSASKLAELPYGDAYFQDPRVIRAYEYSDRAEWVLYLQIAVALVGLSSLLKVDWRRTWGIYIMVAVYLWALLFVA